MKNSLLPCPPVTKRELSGWISTQNIGSPIQQIQCNEPNVFTYLNAKLIFSSQILQIEKI